MPAQRSVPTSSPSLRERRRAAAVREILDAAEHHIALHGPAALSLRAVARSLGMTVQALYHYFPNRDALVTDLIAKAYSDLSQALRAAVDAAPEGPSPARLVAVAEAYRGWGVAHPERFQLLYGTPLRYYAAPADGPTTQAVRQMGALFQRELFDGFTPAQLAAADVPPLSPPFRERLARLAVNAEDGLPPAGLSLFLGAWGQLHGLVVLEVFGHTAFLEDHGSEIFRSSVRMMVEDIHRRIPAGAPG
ncbi:TetR/AcrR family transcriptional regulator [Streptomyces olivaceus]|uniref:TetR/AcrR family transcriptional regulator n=1 Tax=Streptomyces olivaceus TaxID=47716 RepID=UPI001CCA93A6|nr:TetR/AcrR family transcriptional regulator [Streptomyces olivaceus]MBZ6231639.1 TetR/AcrR family transcriptional regulator [Streptomyces olivaceus]